MGDQLHLRFQDTKVVRAIQISSFCSIILRMGHTESKSETAVSTEPAPRNSRDLTFETQRAADPVSLRLLLVTLHPSLASYWHHLTPISFLSSPIRSLFTPCS